MKLTNEMRDDFVNDVMAKLPWKNLMTDTLAINELCDRAMALVPDDVKALNKKYPGLMAMTTFNFNAKDGLDGDYPDGMALPTEQAVSEPGIYGRSRYWTGPIPVVVDGKKVKRTDIVKKVLARDAEVVQRYEMKRQLAGIARSCTTLAALQKALPDLVSYMPKEAKASTNYAVVPAGFISSLKKAGLPVPKEVVAA